MNEFLQEANARQTKTFRLSFIQHHLDEGEDLTLSSSERSSKSKPSLSVGSISTLALATFHRPLSWRHIHCGATLKASATPG